jgi:RHH-type proline utilization regulon transcriptional repressor/proline dehydrogenase/delta 1-pyrroline-5-carboxylate dehydrogenase
MRARGRRVEQVALPEETARGTFVAPTIIEIGSLAELKREVFGPVLHMVRFRRVDLDRLIDDINATGYGLTFGLHTRLDETIAHVTGRVRAGNLYVNRNIIGAVVGVQPFGGRGLSGTGPKAGGPLYLGRLVQSPPLLPRHGSAPATPELTAFVQWLRGRAGEALAARIAEMGGRSALGMTIELAGPVGERNSYALHPRGRILLVPETAEGLLTQLGAVLATGNSAVADAGSGLQDVLDGLPAGVAARVAWSGDWSADGPYAGALVEGSGERVRAVAGRIATLPGPLVLSQAAASEGTASDDAWCLDWLLEEVSTSVNTAAAGGNASLMSIG